MTLAWLSFTIVLQNLSLDEWITWEDSYSSRMIQSSKPLLHWSQSMIICPIQSYSIAHWQPNGARVWIQRPHFLSTQTLLNINTGGIPRPPSWAFAQLRAGTVSNATTCSTRHFTSHLILNRSLQLKSRSWTIIAILFHSSLPAKYCAASSCAAALVDGNI